MKPTLKIKENLYLEDMKFVISYETVVAEIDGNKIVEYGRFSRTTTKHISFLANKLGYGVISSKQKNHNFYKHEMGVKCTYDSLTQKTSNLILDKIKEKGDFLLAVLSVENDIPKKDRPAIEKYLGKLNASEKTLKIIKGITKLGL